MKQIIISIGIAIVAISCNSNKNEKTETSNTSDTSQNIPVAVPDSMNVKASDRTASIEGIVDHYIMLKNSLTNDNGKEAASHANEVVNAIQKVDPASLNSEQKKVYDDVVADAREHAEHIAGNAGKIEHQREHFDMLSTDVYDLVKVIKPQRTLYKDFCPMYNNKKGAIWLSEVKDIKNPYYGKKMLTCGSVKEEIK